MFPEAKDVCKALIADFDCDTGGGFCRAPVAVGNAASSSEEMLSAGMKGRGVCVLHAYMDHLWRVLFALITLLAGVASRTAASL